VRARIILLAAEDKSNTEIATRLGVSRPTVVLWRRLFAERDTSPPSRARAVAFTLLADRPRPGRPGTPR
jgi:hypothetical protein